MRVLEIDTPAALAEQGPAWDALFEQCPAPTPAQSHAWTQAFLRYAVPAGQRWLCLLAYDQNTLVGVLALILDRRWGLPRGLRWGLSGLALQRFKGLFDPFHTVGADALIAPGQPQVMPAFVRHLQQRFKAVPAITLLRVAPSAPESTTRAPKTGPKLSVIERPADQEAFIELHSADDEDPGTKGGNQADAHHQRLKAKFRRDIERQARRLQEVGEVRYRLNERSIGNAESLGRFAEIEDSGWKGAEGTSLRRHQHDLALFAQATEAFTDRGWMEWSFLDAAGETIAAQLGVRIQQRLFLWKVAYREDYRRCAPSNLLLYQLLISLAERPVIRELNFMNDREWLRPFRPQRRQRVDRFIFPAIPGIASLLRAMLALKQRIAQRRP